MKLLYALEGTAAVLITAGILYLMICAMVALMDATARHEGQAR